MNHPLEYKDKEKGTRRQNLQPPSLLHPFVFAVFIIIIIVKWQLGGQTYIPFLDSTMSLKTRDYGLGCFHDIYWLTGNHREKITWKAHSQGWQGTWDKGRYFTEVGLGSHDLQFLFYTEVVGGSMGWALEKANKRPQQVKWPSKWNPTGRSRALDQLVPPPHSHLSTLPWKGNLCSHHTNDLPFCGFFLDYAPLHCFTHRRFSFRSGVSSGVREVTSLQG